METLKELKAALKTWEQRFFKENERKPNREDINLSSEKVQDAYRRYYKLKAELGHPPTPACKNKPEEVKEEVVWGQSLNRSFERNQTPKTTPAKSNDLENNNEECKTPKFLEKLSTNMFINSKKCDAMKKLTRHRSLLGSQSVNRSKNGKSVSEEDVDFQDSKDDSLLYHSIDSIISNQDVNSSTYEDVFESSTPKHSTSVSKHSSAQVVSPSIFKTIPNISTPMRHLKTRKPFQFETPDMLLNKKTRKFSISTSFSHGEGENTSSQYSGFEFYTNSSPEKSLVSPDLNNTKQSVDFSDKSLPCSITSKNICDQKELDKNNEQRTSSLNKPAFCLDSYNSQASSQENLLKSTDCSNKEKLPPSHNLNTNTDTEDLRSKDPDSCDYQTSQRKRSLIRDNDSVTPYAKRVKRKEISSPDLSNEQNRTIEDESVDNNANENKILTKINSQKSIDDDSDDDVSSKKVKKTSANTSAPSRSSKINGSQNFVRLNMKIKRYSKKGQRVKGAIYKRQQWKKRQRDGQKSYGDKCFRCGQSGHWASKCTNAPAKAMSEKTTKIKPEQEKISVDEGEYPTVAEAAAQARGVSLPKKSKDDPSSDEDVESMIVRTPMESFIKKPTCESIEPLYSLNSDGSLPDATDEVEEALLKFGFSEFRQGQKQAIMRTLCGLSTLVILSTGCGKSLCYQLPAYMYSQRSKCVTIVVSPLVSLMEDQIAGLPVGIHGACLHTNMTQSQRDAVIAAVNMGNVHFLLLSPEAVVGRQKSVLSELNKDVKIAFACIDEAHCLSQWSHNFRPSYLQVCQVLKNKFGVNCFLGLTATATLSQSKHIAEHLWISGCDEAVIRGAPVPKNLILSVSRDSYRDESLLELLQGERFSKCESIIIYCTRRDQTERIATLIRTCLQEKFLKILKEAEEFTDSLESETKKKKKKTSKKSKPKLICEAYHAGLTAYQRKRIQNAFMSGQLWIVVATVAFGMGLDKSDVRAVIHYNMPRSFESYVQEIGRAGRDRKTSHCHLFLDGKGNDMGELKKHVYSNAISRFTVKKFIKNILKRCRCLEIHKKCSQKKKENFDGESSEEISNTFLDFRYGNRICKGHERAVPIEPFVNELDLKQENIATLFCYLELGYEGLLKSLPLTYATCKVNCYGGPAQLQQVAKRCPPMGVAIARQKLEGQKFSDTSFIQFPVIELSDSMGWNSGLVKRELKMLQWNVDSSYGSKKSGVMIELSDLSFHFFVPGDLTDEEHDSIVDNLYERVTTQQKLELNQINRVHKALKSVSYNSIYACSDKMDSKRNESLHELILEYFDKTSCEEVDPNEEADDGTDVQQLEYNTDQVRANVRKFLSIYSHEHTFTGHSIARIFHGIDSPCYPAKVWGRVRQFWRLYIGSNFQTIVNISSEEIVNLRR